MTAVAEARKVRAGTSTSSPRSTPAAATAAWSAAVPLFKARQWRTPMYSAHAFSSAGTASLLIQERRPERRVSTTAAMSSSSTSGQRSSIVPLATTGAPPLKASCSVDNIQPPFDLGVGEHLAPGLGHHDRVGEADVAVHLRDDQRRDEMEHHVRHQ